MRLLLLLLFTAVASPLAHAARFETHKLAVDGDVISVATADLDGDGKRDLLVAYRHGLAPAAKRFFAVFWNGGGNFSAHPDLVLPVDESVCAFDVADIDGHAGSELLTVAHDGVSARSFAGRRAATPAALTHDTTLFVRGDKSSLPRLTLVHAIATPHSHELVVPMLGGLAIYRAEHGVFVEAARLELELRNEIADERRANSRAAVPAFNVTVAFPAVEIGDTDGDGLRDLLLVDEDRVTVFRQKPGLAFARAGAERNFDVRTVAERKDSFSTAIVRVADLDGDGVVDLVLQKQVTHGVTSAVTTNYVYLGRRGGGWDDKPNQILRSEGLGGIGLELLDVTGDGRPDLIMPTVVMGVWQIIRVLTTKTLKVNLQVFPFGADRKFADKPSAERELRFHVALSGDGDLPAFDLRGDYNGDRRRDLAFGDEGDEIGFYLGQDGARLAKDAVDHANVNAAATVEPVDLDGKGKDDLVLYYPNTKGHRSEVAVLVNRGPW
jgi:hypothetical protein